MDGLWDSLTGFFSGTSDAGGELVDFVGDLGDLSAGIFDTVGNVTDAFKQSSLNTQEQAQAASWWSNSDGSVNKNVLILGGLALVGVVLAVVAIKR